MFVIMADFFDRTAVRIRRFLQLKGEVHQLSLESICVDLLTASFALIQ